MLLTPPLTLRQRQVLLDPPRGVDEIHRVVVVLLHPGRDRQDIRIEDDVLRRKADFLGQNAIGALANLNFAFVGVRLSLFIKGHHDHRRAVAADQPRLLLKFSSPSFRLIELTTALPWMHFSPASMTDHFDSRS